MQIISFLTALCTGIVFILVTHVIVKAHGPLDHGRRGIEVRTLPWHDREIQHACFFYR